MEKSLALVQGMIDRYQPDHLTIKQLHPSRHSPELRSLMLRVEELVREQKLTVHHFSIKELQAALCPEEMKNKSQLAETVAANYPELYLELHTERQRKNPYHIRMFEAVALGTVCADSLIQ